jgi:hypothetical protein
MQTSSLRHGFHRRKFGSAGFLVGCFAVCVTMVCLPWTKNPQ